MTEKAPLRRAVLAARRALPAWDRARMDAAVVAALVPLVEGRSVAAYRPLPAEPGGPDLLPTLAARARSVILPVLRPDRDLAWVTADGSVDRAVTAIAKVEIVVVPAVAVGRTGVRLGRGGGSYDRALARVAPDTQTVALLYDGELLDAVPAEPHDRRVNGVITPAGGYVRLG